MSHALDAHAPPTDRREQPFLYTWNRRLRHLHGVSLRNLNINPPAARARGKTIADDDYNLKTVAKALVQREARVLHHAKSFDQLSKAAGASFQSPARTSTLSENADTSTNRPTRAGMRRRSTLHWANSDPRSRQSKLEAVEAERLVISWFSIHHDEWEEPIYISEIMENCMNPSFSFFDLDASIASIVRSDEFTLRVWAKTDAADEHRILVELRVNMRSLQFIGRSLEHFHHPLPENCVLLHLSDGIYTSFTDLPAEVAQQPPLTKAMRTMPATSMASFDALLKLANLDDVMQDALRTRAVLEADINQLLAQTSTTEHAISRLSSERERLRHTKSAKDHEQKAIENSTKAKSELESSLRSRQKLMETAAAERHNWEDRRKQLGQESQRIRKQLQSLDEDSAGQTRRICTSLHQIFPIEPIKNKTLRFTIRNLYLPNSTFSDTNRDEIAAALGFTAQLVYMLSLYLSIPLPYPIELGEATAVIRDDISAGIAQRQFPLQPSGPAYKFEYGVFLLNKNIEFLLNRSGLRVMDIRHTLPNLKYLIFVLTAGTGELPDRKAGGFEGF